MKKILLSIISLAFVGSASAQVSITLDDYTTNMSGGTATYEVTTATTDEHMLDFIVHNETGGVSGLVITRRHVSNPAGWEEYLCWGVNGAIGNCYLHDPNEYWSASSENIPADSSGLLSTYITCSTPGTATYRYYVSTDGQTWLDSVDLIVTSVLSVEESPVLSVNVSPNPATDYINVTASGVNGVTVRVVDVLGNVVLNESMVGTGKQINASKFRNGIYFVMIEAEGVKAVTRKVIVRH